MQKCVKCAALLIPGAKFCSECGTQIEKPHALHPCPNCHSGITDDMAFCPWCGKMYEKVVEVKKNIKVAETIPDMVVVGGGRFFMGTGDFSHSVELTSFKMSAAPITQNQYYFVMGQSPSKFIGGDLPVEGVNWCAAIRYCNALSKMMNLTPCYTIGSSGDFSNIEDTSPVWKRLACDFSANGYRLPTEAEWEYAARGGKHKNDYLYSGSDDLNEVGWFGENSEIKTHGVCEKKPNALGLYDMCGNVSEWVYDEYAEYEKRPQVNPFGPGTMTGVHVKRGGSWLDDAEQCNVFFRSASPMGGKSSSLGFRVCCSLPPVEEEKK